MQTKHLCVLVHIWTKGEVGVPLNWFKLYSKYFYWPFQGDASSVDHLCFFCLFLLCFHVRLFVDAFWSPAKKRLTSWLSFVMSNCGVVTFPLVSWVRCGAWLYRFLILPSFSPCLDLLLVMLNTLYTTPLSIYIRLTYIVPVVSAYFQSELKTAHLGSTWGFL